MFGGRHTRPAVGYSGGRDGVKHGNGRWLLLSCVVVLGALVALFTIRGIRISNLRRQLQASQIAYDEAIIEHMELERELALADDFGAIEDAVREHLGWLKFGEERVIFVDRADQSGSEGE